MAAKSFSITESLSPRQAALPATPLPPEAKDKTEQQQACEATIASLSAEIEDLLAQRRTLEAMTGGNNADPRIQRVSAKIVFKAQEQTRLRQLIN